MTPVFDYFLYHFYAAFQAEGIRISYGVDATAKVCISKSDHSFFEGQTPVPHKLIWKEWKGKKVPFFFAEGETESPILEVNGSQVNITIDIVASAFYLLSGWQEFYSAKRDNFGRFPFSASVQSQYGFVTVPVVNYYFDILREAIKQATGRELTPANWPKSTFAVCLTHDIDRCESGWKIAGKEALKKKKAGELFRLMATKALGNDSWFNMEEIARLEEKYDARSTWFFLPETRAVNGHPNADYDVTLPKYQAAIQQLKERGHEIAVHGSFGTGKNSSQLQAECEKLSVPVSGNRFHYLQFHPEITGKVLEEAGLLWDASLGFAEHFGFRNSYCLPFRPFNFRTRQMHQYAELPLNLMDTTLRHPNYLWLESNQVLPAVTPMLNEIAHFNGCFTLLWHNEHFTGYQIENDRQIYEDLLLWCKYKGATFLTASEATQHLRV